MLRASVVIFLSILALVCLCLGVLGLSREITSIKNEIEIQKVILYNLEIQTTEIKKIIKEDCYL